MVDTVVAYAAAAPAHVTVLGEMENRCAQSYQQIQFTQSSKIEYLPVLFTFPWDPGAQGGSGNFEARNRDFVFRILESTQTVLDSFLTILSV